MTKRLRATLVRLRRDRRGSVLMLTAISLVAILGTVALAVDVGLLYSARGEAQKAADAAALAGAGNFLAVPDDGAAAGQVAETIGELNTVRERGVEIEPPEDVVVDLAAKRVTVTVRRIAARGNAVPAFFARIFGLAGIDVAATATAEAVPVGSVGCVKPFAPPDAFKDVNGNGRYDPGNDYYDTEETGYGSDFRNTTPANNGMDPNGTIYQNDFGRPVVLKEGVPGEVLTPSQYFPITLPLPQGGFTEGAADYRDAIANCRSAVIDIGDAIPTEPGRMVGPTRQGMLDLIALDPNANWNPGADGPTGSSYEPWRSSPRVIHIPLFDPRKAPGSGRKDIEVANVTAFWVERMQGNDVVGRFLFASGAPGGSGSPGTGPGLYAVRLIR